MTARGPKDDEERFKAPWPFSTDGDEASLKSLRN